MHDVCSLSDCFYEHNIFLGVEIRCYLSLAHHTHQNSTTIWNTYLKKKKLTLKYTYFSCFSSPELCKENVLSAWFDSFTSYKNQTASGMLKTFSSGFV